MWNSRGIDGVLEDLDGVTARAAAEPSLAAIGSAVDAPTLEP